MPSTTITSTNGAALVPAVYHDSGEVKALATRIMAIHPSAKQIGERGGLLLAQLGLALGLNPLPGANHLFAWLDEDGRMAVHIGLEGRAALARRQSLYSVSTRPMSAAEAEEHGLKPGDRGAVAELYRHDLTREQAALKIPVRPFVGIGIAKGNERIPRGRSLAWRASQRATKDALRAAFSFDLPGELAGAVRLVDDEPADVVEGAVEGRVIEHSAEAAEQATGPASPTGPELATEPATEGAVDSPPAESTEAATESTEAQASTEAPPPARPYNPATLRAALATRAAGYKGREATKAQRGPFAAALELCFPGETDAEARRHQVQQILFGQASAANIAPDWLLAGLDWLRPVKSAGGAYLPDPLAVREARAALEEGDHAEVA